MTTKFWQWLALGIILLWAAGCRRAAPVTTGTGTAVSSTHSSTPTLTSPAKLTASPTKITATATPFFTPDPALLPICPTATVTPTPEALFTPLPSPLPSATVFYCNTITPSPPPTLTPTPTRGPVPVGMPDPSAPFVQGDYAYLGDNGDLLILDISDPAIPELVGRFFSSYADIASVRVAGSYVYVARDNGLQIVDISNPIAPYLVSYYPAQASVLNIIDELVYLVEGYYRLHIIDISDPRMPKQIDLLEIQNEESYNNYGIQEVVVVGDYVYLPSCSFYRHNVSYGTVRIANVSIPSRSYFVDDYNLVKDQFRCLGIVGGIDNTLYFTGYYFTDDYKSQYELYQVDITDPARPKLISQYSVPHWITKVVGHYAYSGFEHYVYSGFKSGLLLTDVPGSLDSMSDLSVVTSRKGWDVAVIGHYVYIVDEWQANRPRLRVYDISDPDNPVLTYESDF